MIINASLKVLINLARAQAVISRRFDRLNMYGIGFNDFVILYLLQQSVDGKMRRIDLADKIGITASGVTRLLLPMEKRGLIARESDKRDARVSYALLTPAGKQLFADTKKAAETLATEIISAEKVNNIQPLIGLLAGFEVNIF